MRRLALAGVLTLAGQQLRRRRRHPAGQRTAPDGTQVVYTAGLTLFLVPWAALAVPLATSAYPGLAERAEAGDEPGYRRALAPAAVLVVAASAVAAGAAGGRRRGRWRGSSWPRDPAGTVAALRDTIVAFAPGLVGLRPGRRCSPGRCTPAGCGRRRPCASSGAGCWPSPPTSSWPQLLPAEDRGLALALGHTLGVTVAGLGLLVVVVRVGRPGRAAGLPRAGAAAAGRRRARRRRRAAGRPGAGRRPGAPTGVLAAVRRRRAGRGDRARRRAAVMMGTARAVPRLRRRARASAAEPTDPTTDRRCTVAERVAPARAAAIAEVLATSTGGVGTPRPLVVLPALRAPAPTVTVCGPAATEELFAFTATGADFRPVGISAGLDPLADGRAVAALRRAAGGAELVHAHGLRAGLVAAVARRPRRPARGRGPHPAQRPAREPGARQRVLQVLEGITVRGADLVLAASGDLADNARRLGGRDVRTAPALGAAAAARRRAPPTRCAPSWGWTPTGRWSSPSAGCTRRRATTSCSTRSRAGRTTAGSGRQPLVAIAGDGPLEDELAARIAAERLPVRLLGRRSDVADLLAAADLCVLPSRWEGARSPPRRRCGRARRWSPPAPAGCPSCSATRRRARAGRRRRRPGRRGRPVLADPARAAELAEAGPRQAAGWPDEAATARQLVAVYRELLGAPGRPRGRPAAPAVLLAVLLALLLGAGGPRPPPRTDRHAPTASWSSASPG